jgi:soluble P-type ATPase
MRYYCPQCWKDFVEDMTYCPYCSLNIAEFFKGKDYVERLIVALDHPEPETPMRAAFILGRLQDERAVEPLIKLIGATQDVYIARAAVEALSRMGTPRASQYLRAVATTHPAAMVRDLAAGAVSGSFDLFIERSDMNPNSINLEIQGGVIRTFTDMVLDYTGTLSLDGILLPGVAERLTDIAAHLRITILTADTFGKAAGQIKGLPVDFGVIQTGMEKADAVLKMGGENVIAIGNGRNDVPMMRHAGLRIAVIGPEGASAELLQVADVVVHNICDSLDLVIHPLRLKATLRD